MCDCLYGNVLCMYTSVRHELPNVQGDVLSRNSRIQELEEDTHKLAAELNSQAEQASSDVKREQSECARLRTCLQVCSLLGHELHLAIVVPPGIVLAQRYSSLLCCEDPPSAPTSNYSERCQAIDSSFFCSSWWNFYSGPRCCCHHVQTATG